MLGIGSVPSEGVPAAAGSKAPAARAAKVAAADGAPQGMPGHGEVLGRLETVNSFMAALKVDLRFELLEDSGALIILVLDGTTGDVIRRIPPEYFLQATLDLTGTASRAGIILDEGV